MDKTVYLSVSSDIVHEGILNVMERACQLGTVIVGVLSDETIASYKRPPILDEDSRLRMYANLKGVSRAMLQKTLSYRENLLEVRPDFVVHGDDWRTGIQSSVRKEVVDTLGEWGGKLVEVPYTRGVSMSGLESDLRAAYASPDARRGALRKLLATRPRLRALEASNGLSGLIVEAARFSDPESGAVRQFDAMWVSSLCDSAFKGKPDIELVDFTSRIATITEIMEVTTKPIILDGDTGGRVEHFAHNVRTLERIGVSAVIIEDKTGLKQNSLFGTQVPQLQDDPHAFAAKILAGKRAQRTRDFMIFARIESFIAKAGLDDAMMRARIYLEEGHADGIMIHSKEKDGKEILEFLSAFRSKWPEVPVVLVPTSYNHITDDELFGAGASVVIHANHLLRAAYMAMRNTADSILEHGRSKEADSLCLPIHDVLTLVPKELP
ncbi:phosphoenolpyruvate mutase [Gordonibacter sp. An230]|uniref:phosphoenolpyruvate mutase n=1 Tax=Gordonibacter sp. An230 TaxID=1965592 RepID=UPI000B3A7AA6|nr:phosphoenolpyruvate mutase [Gordonibacter sp. An230]OUO90683.1 phosphoenolpyruvate mutase [Gordonibacter sp. An230]